MCSKKRNGLNKISVKIEDSIVVIINLCLALTKAKGKVEKLIILSLFFNF